MLGEGLKRRLKKLRRNIKRDRYLFLLASPILIYFFIFNYLPMYGAIIAFKDFAPGETILSSQWVGIRWFREFFHSVYFVRLIKNTFLLSALGLLFNFPVPIIFALLLNEVQKEKLKRSVQTISYLPHFVSLVVMVGIMSNFLSPTDGIVNNFLVRLGFEPINFLGESSWFRALYIGSGIWQSFGWNSIIYMAALTSIDPNLYEAAKIDGCNRWKEIIYITIPGLMPTAIMLLILALGNLMNVGFEKIILMYSPATYDVADVISTYVYRRGILSAQYSFGSAVGLFNSIINFTLLLTVNRISRKVTQIGLW
ncbi:MAG: sugar ABC transporter permease [Clostridiales bacterium]|nr:sugar ABC transporter permease [Clostridiales bacterium]